VSLLLNLGICFILRLLHHHHHHHHHHHPLSSPSTPTPSHQVNDIPVEPSISVPHPARPNERSPWAIITSAVRPGSNNIVLAGAEQGQFAVMVALARRRSVPEVEQLLAAPLSPHESMRRVRGLLAEPPTAQLHPPQWQQLQQLGQPGSSGQGVGVRQGGGASSDGQRCAGRHEGGAVVAVKEEEVVDVALDDELPPVPLMQVLDRELGWVMGSGWCRAAVQYAGSTYPIIHITVTHSPNRPLCQPTTQRRARPSPAQLTSSAPACCSPLTSSPTCAPPPHRCSGCAPPPDSPPPSSSWHLTAILALCLLQLGAVSVLMRLRWRTMAGGGPADQVCVHACRGVALGGE